MIVSLTHELDLDGLGSQAILYRYFQLKNRTKIKDEYLNYVHYTNFVEKVTSILHNVKQLTKLIISDIGFNDNFRDLFPIFKQAVNKGIEICWFDHHIIDSEVKLELESILTAYLNDPKRCTAEIVKDYYLPKDSISIEIAEMAHDVDFRKSNREKASILQSIISYNRGKNNDSNKRKIVKLLSKGEFSSNFFKEQLVKLREWEVTQSNNALKNTEIINLPEFGDVIISHAPIGGGKITLLLEDRFPDAKCYFGIDSRYNEVILYSHYINCRKFARKFEGGGHKTRAGFKYHSIFDSQGNLKDDFIEIMINTLSQIRISNSIKTDYSRYILND